MIATRGPDTQKLVTSHCSALLAADPKSTVDTLVSGSSFQSIILFPFVFPPD